MTRNQILEESYLDGYYMALEELGIVTEGERLDKLKKSAKKTGAGLAILATIASMPGALKSQEEINAQATKRMEQRVEHFCNTVIPKAIDKSAETAYEIKKEIQNPNSKYYELDSNIKKAILDSLNKELSTEEKETSSSKVRKQVSDIISHEVVKKKMKDSTENKEFYGEDEELDPVEEAYLDGYMYALEDLGIVEEGYQWDKLKMNMPTVNKKKLIKDLQKLGVGATMAATIVANNPSGKAPVYAKSINTPAITQQHTISQKDRLDLEDMIKKAKKQKDQTTSTKNALSLLNDYLRASKSRKKLENETEDFYGLGKARKTKNFYGLPNTSRKK